MCVCVCVCSSTSLLLRHTKKPGAAATRGCGGGGARGLVLCAQSHRAHACLQASPAVSIRQLTCCVGSHVSYACLQAPSGPRFEGSMSASGMRFSSCSGAACSLCVGTSRACVRTRLHLAGLVSASGMRVSSNRAHACMHAPPPVARLVSAVTDKLMHLPPLTKPATRVGGLNAAMSPPFLRLYC